MGAGKLHEKYSFQKRVVQGNDGLGNVLSDWVEQFQQRGNRKFMRGGEDVLASRLEGVQPAILTVRKSSNTDLVSPDWRAVDVRSGVEYNIRSVEQGESRQTYEMLVQSGVAAG